MKGKNRKGQGRKLSYPKELDDDILKWFLEKHDLQLAVSTEMLKQHTKTSDGWVQKVHMAP